jgi:hypothetical protein
LQKEKISATLRDKKIPESRKNYGNKNKMKNNPPVNLTPLQKDYSVFLPAISGFYSTYVSKQQAGEYVPKNRIPADFDRGIEGMNFLNPEQGYFTYKYGLFSAGHAQLDIQKSITQESMIQGRDRTKTMILGDSGGYQIGKGILKFDWADFEGPKASKVRQQILEWLELTADWSMMLDVPTWACDRVHSPKTGLKTFEDCLEKTKFNNNYFLTNRLGQTKFLNVLQGSDWETAEKWYQGVKEFSDPAVWGDKAAEGWAFGGANMCRMDVTLKRLMTLREDGLLANKNWIHFLGTAQLDWACFLTSIQRQIRRHINEEISISFDCASPFIATANGLVYTNAQHLTKRWAVIMDKAPDNKSLAKSDIPFPFESEVGRRLVMGDICHYAPGMLNKIGKEGKTSWDSFSYALMMGHNVYCHIVAVQRANHLADIEYARFKPDWRQWIKMNSKTVTSDELSDWVPRNVLYFNTFIQELFETKTKAEAFKLIEQVKPFLQNLEGARSKGWPAQNQFGSLFSVEEITKSEEIDMENPEDPALRKLEGSMDE